MTSQANPIRMNLKKDEKLQIEWSDGVRSEYSIATLRSMCPCAQCREVRAGEKQKKSLLTILPGNYSQAITVTSAEMVGNYALKLVFSDGHDLGIYSFEYLREMEKREDVKRKT